MNIVGVSKTLITEIERKWLPRNWITISDMWKEVGVLENWINRIITQI